jgi:hypothetical protein
MKILFVSICCILTLGSYAQTVTTKTFAASSGQQITLKFDYPKVKISTWDKNEVSITSHVSINDGESDNAFELQSETVGGKLVISDRIKDMDKLPRRYTIVRNGNKTTYKLKAEYLEARKNAAGITQSTEGTDIDITVEVKIPVSAITEVKSVYGIVELTDFNAPITVDATYGGIDATITPANTGKLQVTTNYGQMYSNLDLKVTEHAEHSFFNSITAEPGKGPNYKFTSTYGKIYLRKP